MLRSREVEVSFGMRTLAGPDWEGCVRDGKMTQEGERGTGKCRGHGLRGRLPVLLPTFPLETFYCTAPSKAVRVRHVLEMRLCVS